MRVINFNPGPAAIPLPALERARDELLDFENSGMSIMEHSHRGKEYDAVHREAIALVTRLLSIPESHIVLFSTGGASMQFALIPMNFLTKGQSADYVLTGGWSEKAHEEAKLIGAARVAGSTRLDDGRYTRVPTASEVQFDPHAAYVHTTSNNTLFGTQFHQFLETGSVPHVCDMSSDFLWKPIDVSKFDLIYAGAQKNLGPSGVVVVVARKSFLMQGRTDIPKIFRYQTLVENDSLYNTPPTFAIYLVRNVLRWIETEGGLPAMERRNRAKAARLYSTIDALAGFYRAPVELSSRSTMNVVFRLPTAELDEQFVAEAKKAGMVGLKGHRLTGGIRVSTYNAVSERDVETLTGFMRQFAQTNG
jgi:phosphoserine aminotransferase